MFHGPKHPNDDEDVDLYEHHERHPHVLRVRPDTLPVDPILCVTLKHADGAVRGASGWEGKALGSMNETVPG